MTRSSTSSSTTPARRAPWPTRTRTRTSGAACSTRPWPPCRWRGRRASATPTQRRTTASGSPRSASVVSSPGCRGPRSWSPARSAGCWCRTSPVVNVQGAEGFHRTPDRVRVRDYSRAACCVRSMSAGAGSASTGSTSSTYTIPRTTPSRHCGRPTRRLPTCAARGVAPCGRDRVHPGPPRGADGTAGDAPAAGDPGERGRRPRGRAGRTLGRSGQRRPAPDARTGDMTAPTTITAPTPAAPPVQEHSA